MSKAVWYCVGIVRHCFDDVSHPLEQGQQIQLMMTHSHIQTIYIAATVVTTTILLFICCRADATTLPSLYYYLYSIYVFVGIISAIFHSASCLPFFWFFIFARFFLFGCCWCCYCYSNFYFLIYYYVHMYEAFRRAHQLNIIVYMWYD